ncbi:MAG: ATPase, T2SS/T4P/T4SS family, partial [Candidatus Omnitrophica bacterium]|nr:ATPase, T2SS/T4P/T4SS family [Candidatus Omnitrophota bacterium]
MLTQDNILIGQMLVKENVISPCQLDQALREQQQHGQFICSILVAMGFAAEDKIFNVLSHQLNIPYVNLRSVSIDPAVIQKIPATFVSHYKIMPVEIKDNYLIVAMVNPLDVRIVDDLRLLLNIDVTGVLSGEKEINDAIRRYYGVGAGTIERIISEQDVAQPAADDDENVQNVDAAGEDASIITFVNQVLSEAIKDRATDIHLEPFQDELRARFRIDGVLYETQIPEKIALFHPAIVSRLKVMAHLNIAERRLPQDGRIKLKINGGDLDVRISTLPTAFGEAVHIRLLNTQFFLGLENLGLSAEDRVIIEKVITQPHGILFVTGPTGSGKTTTLYACLAKINSGAVKIITIEDPIEYQLRGINQMQVVSQIGFSFATALRHMLRHDPDIMMVGEVRDFETAEIAIRSALTGHFVFSTLHTNDAAGAVTRLLDMGIEPFLVSSSLECLIAQRLVRVICPHCKAPVNSGVKTEILQYMKQMNISSSSSDFYEGKGCEA